MTTTDSEIDFGIYFDVDIDAAIPCDADKCDNEARWRFVTSCCNAEFFQCDKDYARQMKILTDEADNVNRCYSCKERILTKEWLGRVHPI